MRHLDEVKSKGVDKVAVVAVNDAFVMAYWAEHLGATGKVLMLADGSAEFARKIGMEKDMMSSGMGIRCTRFAMIVRDGVVKYVGVDGEELVNSSVQAVLAKL